MELKEYQERALTTMADQSRILNRLATVFGVKTMQLLNGLVGLQDEVGELSSAVKAHVEYGKKLDRNNVIEEIGDALWRLSQIADSIGTDLGQCAEVNLDKLQNVRYPDGYKEESAQEENRDRKAEAEAMEQTGHGFAEPPIDISSISDEPIGRKSYAEPIKAEPTPKAELAKNWRYIKIDEVIEEGDEIEKDGENNCWGPVPSKYVGRPNREVFHSGALLLRIARRIQPEPVLVSADVERDFKKRMRWDNCGCTILEYDFPNPTMKFVRSCGVHGAMKQQLDRVPEHIQSSWLIPLERSKDDQCP